MYYTYGCMHGTCVRVCMRMCVSVLLARGNRPHDVYMQTKHNIKNHGCNEISVIFGAVSSRVLILLYFKTYATLQ